MAFTYDNGESLINEEQKVRFQLSKGAMITIADDMEVFGVKKTATFINTVFDHYKLEAKASVALYLEQRRTELERNLETLIDMNNSVNTVIETLLSKEKEDLLQSIRSILSQPGESRLYHINDANVEYLSEDCTEDTYYSRPGLYLRAVIEEYCSLPFIRREEIYRKDVFDAIRRACKETRIIKIKQSINGENKILYVYPYKIVPDPLHTRSYLACYSRMADAPDSEKKIASFSMARIHMPTVLSKTFHLNKKECGYLDEQLLKYSPAYLIGTPEIIKVKLTENGKKSYTTRLHSRPEKIDSLSTEDVYAFDCTPLQAFNFFFSFGKDAEILSPAALRDRFQKAYKSALNQYK